MTKKRLGFIARCDNGGLGTLSKYFVKHLNPEKIMVVKIGQYKQFPDRFPNATIINLKPTDRDCEEFCKDIDVLLAWETPYNWNIFRIAKKMGVKTVLYIDYEWFEDPVPVMPDVIINPSNYNMDKLPSNATFICCPVDRQVHPYRLRKTARTFLHIVGHGGGYGRNGTAEFLKAIPLVKAQVKFIIHSQIQIEKIDDPRIEWRVGNYVDEAEMYQDADVFVSPRRYAGLSLPLNEAMSHGIVPLMTDMKPQNAFLPKELLIKPYNSTEIMIARRIEMCFISPEAIAQKIDEIAFQDIEHYSKYSDNYAKSIDWEVLKPRILALFC